MKSNVVLLTFLGLFSNVSLAILMTVISMSQANAAEINYGVVTVDKVVRVYDGDTFFATIEGWPRIIGNNIGIRLLGIDTPEIRGPKCPLERELAYKAKHFLQTKMQEATEIIIKDMYRGKYFRIVGAVYIDGEYASQMLINANLAVPYDGGTKTKDWCK